MAVVSGDRSQIERTVANSKAVQGKENGARIVLQGVGLPSVITKGLPSSLLGGRNRWRTVRAAARHNSAHLWPQLLRS